MREGDRLPLFVPFVVKRLAASLFAELSKRGLQTLVISGISVQQPFYRHIGFQVAGKPVSENGVTFFPMTGDLSAILKANPAWQKYQPQGHSTSLVHFT